jgi:hypothetical protein
MSTQRYVSDELTHFVGRKFREEIPDAGECEQKQYELLGEILRTGTLYGTGGWKGDPEERPKVASWVSWDPDAGLGAMYSSTIVCFCDIPVADVGIHMEKYSRFGLAFDRGFLLRAGTNPVFYLAYDSDPNSPGRFHLEEFEAGIKQAIKYLGARQKEEKPNGGALLLNLFLNGHVFPLIKTFCEDLGDDDPDNFYMEREWRLKGELEFETADVRRVYLPERFGQRFRRDFPHYYGQVTFASR